MGVWGATPMNTGASQVFIEGAPLARLWLLSARAESNIVFPRPAGRNFSCTTPKINEVVSMSNDRLGVIGGMGPQATNTFYQYIIDRTDARTDQEHVNALILSDRALIRCFTSSAAIASP